MKIIFDDEEQKQRFLSMVLFFHCPNNFGLVTSIPNDYDCKKIFKEGNCDECWKRCGLEMEVKE